MNKQQEITALKTTMEKETNPAIKEAIRKRVEILEKDKTVQK